VGFGVRRGTLSTSASVETKQFAESLDGLQHILPSRFFKQPIWRLQRYLANFARKGWPVGALCGDELKIAEWRHCVHGVLDQIISQRQREGALKLAVVTSPPSGINSRKIDTAASEAAHMHRSSSGSESDTAASEADHLQRQKSSGGSVRRQCNASALDETKRLDILELFMRVTPPLSGEQLRDVVMSLLVGGRDTTAVTLSWAFYELARNPLIEARVLAEVRGLAYSNSQELYTELKALKFTEAVVRETIRLHSPIPLDAKVAVADDVLPDGTFVGAGWTVTYSPYCMARDSSLWGPDAEVWRPQRWLEGSLAAAEPSPFVMTSFQGGPRMCLGRDLAVIEAKAVVALLLRENVRLSLAPEMLKSCPPGCAEQPPRYLMGVVLKMASPGLLMNVSFNGELLEESQEDGKTVG